MKIYVGLLVVTLVWSFTTAGFAPEKPCTEAGGVCTHKSLCPNSPFEKGLCPEQQRCGAECCYKPDERECRSIGGECIDNCPPVITHPQPCPAGTRCCVWLT